MEQTAKRVRTHQMPTPPSRQSNAIKSTLSKHVQRGHAPGNTSSAIQTSFEKYTALANEALAGGDRVVAEGYYQKAEHYLRLANERREGMVIPRKSKPMRSIKTPAIPDDFEMSIEQELAMAHASMESA